MLLHLVTFGKRERAFNSTVKSYNEKSGPLAKNPQIFFKNNRGLEPP